MNKEIREYMVEFRTRLGASMRDMAKFANCSTYIIEGVERYGWITHPKIAARIAHAYDLDVDGYNDLVSEQNRVNALPDYGRMHDESDWIKFARKNRFPVNTK